MKRKIDFHDTNTTDLYFKIGKHNIPINEDTFITVSMSKPVKIGDVVYCEWMVYEVLRIEDECPHERRKGFVFQKLIVKRTG